MFASIVTLAILVFVPGVALGLMANGDDRQKLLVSQKESADLRSALAASRFECVEQRMRYEKRISSAYEAIDNYEAIFDELETRNHPKKSAVILPFN